MHPLTGISVRGGDKMNPIVHFVAASFRLWKIQISLLWRTGLYKRVVNGK